MIYYDTYVMHQEQQPKIEKFHKKYEADVWAKLHGGVVIKDSEEDIWRVFNPAPQGQVNLSMSED